MAYRNIFESISCICALVVLLVLLLGETGGARAQNGVVTDVVDATRGRTAIFALYAGDTVVKNDGQYALCSANGVVWHDSEGDGMINEDLSTHGLGGITVQLHWVNGTVADVTTTKKDGSYTFKVEPGTYYVKTACPKDYRHSKLTATSATRLHPVTQVSEAFDVSIDRATTGINAGCYKPALVEGVVFSDKNTNSVQDADEGGVPEVAVELTKSTDTTFRLKLRTDADGKFRFPDLEPSDYALSIIYDAKYYNSPISATKESSTEEGGKVRHRSVTLRASDQPTTKDGRKQLVVSPLQLSSGDRATIKQGLYTLAKVEGVVFRDENANGVWDAREKTLANVKVTLYRVAESGDVAVSQMKSDEVGRYSFTELQPGQYYVVFDTSSPEYKHSSKK
jgi:uncharacterized surface anchored protein